MNASIRHGFGSPRPRGHVTRTCSHPGCTARFQGDILAEYCAEHRSRQARALRDAVFPVQLPTADNMHFLSDRGHLYEQTALCRLPGCGAAYRFVVYPDQTIYPGYCESHRSEFRRQQFTRMMEVGGVLPRPARIPEWPDEEAKGEARRVAKFARFRSIDWSF